MPGRGSIRHRGGTWEYLIEVGMRLRQRCLSCDWLSWVGRRPWERCPKCGGELHEEDERFRVSRGGFRTRKACQAAMTEALTAIEQHAFVLRDDATVRDFILQEWLPAIKGTLRPTTYASYTSLCERHVIPRLGAVQLQKLSPAQLNGLYAYLLEEGRVRGGGGLSNSSVRRVHAVIHRFCHDAVRWGRLTVNPAAAADPPKASAEHDELTVWNAEELAAFLVSAESDRLFGLWRLLAMTGMRRGEALGLRWDDLDMEAGQLSIRRALVPVNGVAQISEPKTKRGRRTIALDPETLEVLKAHAARQADEQALWEGSWSDLGYVFTREDGRLLAPQVVSKTFQALARRAALPRIRLHDLRHTYATLALAAGVNPRIVSARLGHATVAFTLDIYSHVLPQADRDAAERIADLLRPAA